MIPFVQSSALSSQILAALDQASAIEFSEVKWAVAYITSAGCRLLAARLDLRLGSRWRQARKEFVTCCDHGITEPDAVDFLRSLPNSNVLIASVDVLTRPAFKPVSSFHPKLYLFEAVSTVSVVVGSANLTAQALMVNTEAVVLQTGVPAAAWRAAWSSLTAGATAFTPALVEQYRNARSVHIPPAIDPPLSVSPPLGIPPAFWDEVQAGRLNPGAFGNLWIEAGSMSSSASHNQLELPRGANRFFGFSYSQYDGSQTPIGSVCVVIRNTPYRDKKLAWHGDNGMERIYLPTMRQSGLRYRNQLIVFRRIRTGYELDLFPPDSPSARACLGGQLGRVYQVGNRLCGVY